MILKSSSQSSRGRVISVSKDPVNFLSHGFIPLDQRRPRAFETYARNYLCRVDAEFAAAGDFARGMVAHIGRAFGEEAVALRVGVGAEAEAAVS